MTHKRFAALPWPDRPITYQEAVEIADKRDGIDHDGLCVPFGFEQNCHAGEGLHAIVNMTNHTLVLECNVCHKFVAEIEMGET